MNAALQYLSLIASSIEEAAKAVGLETKREENAVVRVRAPGATEWRPLNVPNR